MDSPESVLDHQDWKPIIIKKTKHKSKEVAKITKISDPNKKLEKKIEEGKMEHKKITNELRIKIQQARCSKGFTQKDLASRVNLPVQTINEIESGKAIYNASHINKIKRLLKITN